MHITAPAVVVLVLASAALAQDAPPRPAEPAVPAFRPADEEGEKKAGKPAEKAPDAAAGPAVLVVGPAKVTLYGFLRGDVEYDDSRMDNAVFPQWVLSEARSTGARPNDEDLIFHPRLSRLGVKVEGKPIADFFGAVPTGLLEIDFYNANLSTESRAVPRIRHAFAQVEWPDFETSVLFGQYWQNLSPLFPLVNSDLGMWNAGNTGDRAPQARLTWKTLKGSFGVSTQVAFLLTGAVDQKNLDGVAPLTDTQADGQASGRPSVEGRVAVTWALWPEKKKSAELGIAYHEGWERTRFPVGTRGERHFRSEAIVADLIVPFTPGLILRAEAWAGRNLSDIRGGIGQGVNATTGREISARGGFAEIEARLAGFYRIGLGGTLDDPKNDEVPTGATQATAGRTLNRAAYVANRLDLGKGVELGADWIWWNTQYHRTAAGARMGQGTANRVDVYLMVGF